MRQAVRGLQTATESRRGMAWRGNKVRHHYAYQSPRLRRGPWDEDGLLLTKKMKRSAMMGCRNGISILSKCCRRHRRSDNGHQSQHRRRRHRCQLFWHVSELSVEDSGTSSLLFQYPYRSMNL